MAMLLRYCGCGAGVPDIIVKCKPQTIGRANIAAVEGSEKVRESACEVSLLSQQEAVQVKPLSCGACIRIFPSDGSRPKYITAGESGVLHLGDSLDLLFVDESLDDSDAEEESDEEESDFAFILAQNTLASPQRPVHTAVPAVDPAVHSPGQQATPAQQSAAPATAATTSVHNQAVAASPVAEPPVAAPRLALTTNPVATPVAYSPTTAATPGAARDEEDEDIRIVEERTFEEVMDARRIHAMRTGEFVDLEGPSQEPPAPARPVPSPEAEAPQAIPLTVPGSLDGSSAVQAGPSTAQAGPSTVPAGPSAVPAGPSAAPAGPSAAPAGPSAAPAGTSAAPAGTSAAPAGTSAAPAVTSAAPAGTSAAHPAASAAQVAAVAGAQARPQVHDHLVHAVEKCRPVLQQVQDEVLSRRSPVAQPQRLAQWQKELDGVRQKMASNATIIGIIGTTGAGKSTMLNALVKEPALVPTNGMRACTAAVIELKYHAHPTYKAEIAFITKAEWRSQVEGILKDLEVASEHGGPPVVELRNYAESNSRSDHAVAQAKLEAVVGLTTLQRLFRAAGTLTADMVMAVDNRVTALMGTTASFVKGGADASKQFAEALARYVDSSNNGAALQTWPVVKLATCWHNWEILKTGCVLVDLPGVADANAARGSIARSYITKCNALVITAPIHRAVDDGTARDLLGSEFRRQMLMDGQYENIVFCATKTDYLKPDEIVKELRRQLPALAADLPFTVEEFEAVHRDNTRKEQEFRAALEQKRQAVNAVKGPRTRLGRLRKKVLCAQQLLRLPRSAFRSIVIDEDDSDDDDDASDRDEGQASDDDAMEEVFDPQWGAAPGRPAHPPGPADAMRIDGERGHSAGTGGAGTSGDREVVCVGDADGEQTLVVPEVVRDEQGRIRFPTEKALTKMEDAAPVLRGWLQAMLQAEQELQREVMAQVSHIQRSLSPVVEQRTAALAAAARAFKRFTALVRNAYTKRCLKDQFRDGLRQMFRQAGTEPTARALAVDLPVFTVSSSDAAKLERHRHQGGGASGCFAAAADTDVPALRHHLVQLTHRDRAAQAEKICSLTASALGSIASGVYAAGVMDMDSRLLLKEAYVPAAAALAREVQALPAAASLALRTKIVDTALEPPCRAGVGTAGARAEQTAAGWRRTYCWATYKAAVRPHRLGEYTSRSSAGEISMNGQLIEPVLNNIQVAWDTSFNTTAPEEIRRFAQQARACITRFAGQLMRVLGRDAAAGGAADGMASYRLVCAGVEEGVGALLEDAVEQAARLVEENQRELSRGMKDFIQDRMTPAYEQCSHEVGSGQYNRMDAHMQSHVREIAGKVFKTMTDEALTEIRTLLTQVDTIFCTAAAKVMEKVSGDMGSLWDGDDVPPEARKEVVSLLIQRLFPQVLQACAELGNPAPTPPALDLTKLDQIIARTEALRTRQGVVGLAADGAAGAGPAAVELAGGVRVAVQPSTDTARTIDREYATVNAGWAPEGGHKRPRDEGEEECKPTVKELRLG